MPEDHESQMRDLREPGGRKVCPFGDSMSPFDHTSAANPLTFGNAWARVELGTLLPGAADARSLRPPCLRRKLL